MMNHDYIEQLYERNKRCNDCPSKGRTADFLNGILGLLYPDFEKHNFNNYNSFEGYYVKLYYDLIGLLSSDPMAKGTDVKPVVETFFNDLPALNQLIDDDIQAMYDGDPAARSSAEVIRCYPGFYAIASYRIAHSLLQLGAQLLPRIFTEVAHGVTGIDIHPGASIDRYFCIDHGTGVVIGETAHIGTHVKIYQGVTLGGLSVDKADANKKRHPSIENHVVIYAGATILGGETVIGAHSVIGGNVWLTRSVPPHTKVYYKAAMSTETGDTDIIEFK